MNETRRAVLETLADGPAAGPELAAELEVSRAAVWKQIEALREGGFEIRSGPDGYELGEITAYGADAIEFGLEAPFSIEHHETISSTNDRARALADRGETDLAVVADEQSGGRGRLERTWSSPSGGVWVSVLCRPAIPPAEAPLYTLAAAVATTRAARAAGVDAGIKWPNDVIVPIEDASYRKLAGILTEMEGEMGRVGWLVAGIGVNANVDSETLPEGSTSLRAEVGDVDRRLFVQRLLEEFDALRSTLEAVVPAWRELAVTIGQRVRVDAGGERIVGDAVSVTDSGALVVETGDGRERIAAGDCEHLRPA